MRLVLFLVATALGAAIWWTWDSTSLLYAFLITLALLVLSVGLALVIGDVSRETPTRTYTEDDLDRIESHEDFLRALDAAIRRRGVA